MCDVKYKICNKCLKKKTIDNFQKRKDSKDGYRNDCKSCRKKYTTTYWQKNKESLKKKKKIYYENNKNEILDKSRKYYCDNVDDIKEYQKNYRNDNFEKISEQKKVWYYENINFIKIKKSEYYQKNKQKVDSVNREYALNKPEKIKSHKEKYYNNNKELINKKAKLRYVERYYNDLEFKLNCVCRNILKKCLKSSKDSKTHVLLGYKPSQLKQRIEMNFKEGMSWCNYGEWHIDHIKPISAFDKNTPPNIINALCNLRPLWAEENLKKSNKW